MIPDDVENPRKAPKGLPAVGVGNQFQFGYIVGSIGTGKTTFLLNYLDKYFRTRTYDYVFWCSSTSTRDAKVKHVLSKALEDGYLQDVFYSTDFPLHDIETFIDTKLEDWQLTQKYISVWKRYMKVLKESGYKYTDLQGRFEPDEILLLERFEFLPPEKYPLGKPTFCLVCDDMLGNSEVYSTHMNHGFNRFITTLRHRRCSVFVSSQSWTQTIPPSLRAMVNMFALFRCSYPKIRKDLSETLCGHAVTPTEFEKMWVEAVSNNIHNCFVGLLHEPEDTRFRINLNKGFEFGNRKLEIGN